MKIKTIDVNGKEWFDKVNGNSYFAARVTVNYGTKTEKSFKLDFQYGYGDHYRDMAFKELQKRGYIPDQEPMTSYWQYYRDNKIIARRNMQRNCLKRDVINL